MDKWYQAVAVSNSNNKIENKEINKNENEKIKTNIDKNKIKNNSLSSPLSRCANKKMNNQTKDKLLAQVLLQPNNRHVNEIKIENNFLKFEKLLKCSKIQEKKTKKKDFINYGERIIVQNVSGKRKKSDFPTNFITENSVSKKNTKINSKPCSKKNRNNQISFEGSFGPENVLFNGKDTSYVDFLSSVNLIRENIVKGTKAARTEGHPSTDIIGNMKSRREESEDESEYVGEDKGGVEDRKSDYDSDSLSPYTHNTRNFDHSDADNINKSGISDPESLNNSIRDVLVNSYNASLHDSMIDTYDVFNTVRTAESLKHRSKNTAGVTVSYLVPPVSTSTSIPIPLTAASHNHSHNQRNQDMAIEEENNNVDGDEEEEEEEEEEGIIEREREIVIGRAGTKTQSESVIGAYEKPDSKGEAKPSLTSVTETKTKTQMETVTGMGTGTVTKIGIGMGTGRGMGSGMGRGEEEEEGLLNAERSAEDWIAWARRGARLPLSDSVNNITNTNNLTSTATSMPNKSENEFQDLGSKVEIRGNVFYHEDFLPVFSTKVIESSRNVDDIEYDYVDEEKMQETTNDNDDNRNEKEFRHKNEIKEQINEICDNDNNNYHYDNNKKSDDRHNKFEVESDRYKEVGIENEIENDNKEENEEEDEDDLLVYDMPQCYDDYYEYNRVLDNNNNNNNNNNQTYYLDPITLNDNDVTQSYNAKEFSEDTKFENKTITEMNIYTELDETGPYAMSSEPYNFLHGIRKNRNSSISYAKDDNDEKDFYHVVDKVRGKVKVGKYNDKEESYYLSKGIAFPSRGTRTNSRIKIKSAESSDLSDYHGPSAAILQSYMEDIYKQSSN